MRLDDLRFALNELTRLDATPGGDLAGRLDLSRVALIGHSLGGLTTLRALQAEPRFKAGAVLDAVMPPHFAKPIEQPVLSLVAGRKQWNEDDCKLWDVLQGPRLAVNFPGAEHIAFSDAVWLLKGSVSTGTTSEAMIAATRSYVAAFLDANLRGRDLQLLLAGVAPGTAGPVVADGLRPLCPSP